MQTRIEPRLLKGFRDFLPEEEAHRRWMLQKIANAFEICGFEPIQTPTIEYLDILMGKYGEEGEKLLYHFKDHGQRDVALRYDLTVPLARFVAQHRDIARPFKRYQIGSVFRAEKPAHGRFREFVQCDADCVGSASFLADAECVSAGILALKALGLENFQVRIGHRGVLSAILEHFSITNHVPVLRALDKLEKQGEEAVIFEIENLGIDTNTAKRLIETVKSPEGLTIAQQVSPVAVHNLRQIIEALSNMGFRGHVTIDLTIARGLDYYTGAVFETNILDLPDMGSVMSGGRYDSLLGMFCGEDLPAVGISIGVDRLFAALVELGLFQGARQGVFVVVCPFEDVALPLSLRVLQMLRQVSIPSEVMVDFPSRPKKQLAYAGRRRARFAVLVGGREVQENSLTVKDLSTGEQRNMGIEEAIGFLRSQFGAESGNRQGT
jgi:histidyl-tRNA synthetase